MNADKLQSIHITADQRQRTTRSPWLICGGVAVITLVAVWFAAPKPGDDRRVFKGKEQVKQTAPAPAAAATASLTSGSTKGRIGVAAYAGSAISLG